MKLLGHSQGVVVNVPAQLKAWSLTGFGIV